LSAAVSRVSPEFIDALSIFIDFMGISFGTIRVGFAVGGAFVAFNAESGDTVIEEIGSKAVKKLKKKY
jgi:hypothetical protein